MKRGTDHTWRLIRYKADTTIYAECKCGYKYACSCIKRNPDGSLCFEQYLTRYCPNCGARKKYVTDDIEMKDGMLWS